MDQAKRKLTFSQLLEKKEKRVKNDFHRSITCFENLSNELFYEILDYFDGCDIYKAFSNLNYRFQQLITSPSVLLKIRLNISPDEIVGDLTNSQQFICTHKHQIFSISIPLPYLNSPVITSFITIDSSLDRLESLVVCNIHPNMLISFLINLAFLPRLFSLSIDTLHGFINLNEVFRLMFDLSKLKYNKFSLCGKKLSISLPMATNKQLTAIKYLIIQHSLIFSELSTIISYTPELYRLDFRHTYDSDATIGNILPITLSNLTYLSMDLSILNFDEFEMFIRKIYSKLKVLRLRISYEDITYLNANRWEKIILQYLPQLEEFYFQYFESLDDEDEYPVYSEGLNQFSSSFWIKRQWIFDVEIVRREIIYLIRPYRKRWYEYTQDNIINSFTDLLKSNRLIISPHHFDEPITVAIKHILTVVQIYHLEYSDETICTDQLIEIIDLLPDLSSIRIHSLSLTEAEVNVRCLTKITKVCLDNITEMEEVYFLMKLCPNLIYLRIDCLDDIDDELFVENILNKINQEYNDQLRLLCFYVEAADDETIQNLEKLINLGKLLLDYAIQRVGEKIYLKWK